MAIAVAGEPRAVPVERDLTAAQSDDLGAISPELGIRSPCPGNVLEVRLAAGSDAVQPGETVNIELWQRDLSESARGFQAFAEFDSAALSHVESTFTPSPYGLIILDAVSGDDLDVAAGIDNSAGQAPTTSNGLLVTISFVAGAIEGATQVSFRTHDPPTRFVDALGLALLPCLIDSPPIVIDGTAPAITCPADVTVGCDEPTEPAATGSATAIDDLDPEPAVSHTDSTDLSGCLGTGVIERTWSTTDRAGLQSSCVQIITVEDSSAPDFVLLPDEKHVNADAGGCDAALSAGSVGFPAAEDNCDSEVQISFARSDGATHLDDPFHSADSPITITWTAADDCGNETVHVQTVTVNPVNAVSAMVALSGVSAPNPPAQPLTRCLRFVARDSTTCAGAQHATVEFEGSSASGIAEFTVACGAWTQVCAKDEQHSLWGSLSLEVADGIFTTAEPLALAGGDTDNDGDVDINDVTLLLLQYNTLAHPGGCPWNGTRDADFSNNGAIGTEDYTFLTANWLAVSGCACATAQSADGSAEDIAEMARPQAVLRLTSATPAMLRQLDLTADNVIDHQDIREFERRHGWPHALSERMRQEQALQPATPTRPAGVVGR